MNTLYVTCESRVVIKQQTRDSFQGLRDTNTSVYMSEARCVSSGGFMAVCVCVCLLRRRADKEGGHGVSEGGGRRRFEHRGRPSRAVAV